MHLDENGLMSPDNMMDIEIISFRYSYGLPIVFKKNEIGDNKIVNRGPKEEKKELK